MKGNDDDERMSMALRAAGRWPRSGEQSVKVVETKIGGGRTEVVAVLSACGIRTGDEKNVGV